MSSNGKIVFNRRTAGVCMVLNCLLTSAMTAFAQGAATPTEKWQPKDGIYASPGKDFEADCNEAHFIVIELGNNSVIGNEWSCKIDKRTNTAVDAINLDMTCHDYNLTQSLYPKDPNAMERKIKETMLLRRLDNGAISIRMTINNKFTRSFWRAEYCPEPVQSRHIENRAEAKLKAVEEEARRNPWRPKAGVYVSPGADFAERCLNGGEAIIDLADRSISIGGDKCSVLQIREELNTLQVISECDSPLKAETILLRKLDNKAVLLQKTKNGNFSDAGEQLLYCGSAAQAKYAQQKSRKSSPF